MHSYDRTFKWESVVSNWSSFPSDSASTTKPTTLTHPLFAPPVAATFQPFCRLHPCQSLQFVPPLFPSSGRALLECLGHKLCKFMAHKIQHSRSLHLFGSLYIQFTSQHPEVSAGSPPLIRHQRIHKKSQAMRLSENKECNLIQRRRCLYAHEMNSFIAV